MMAMACPKRRRMKAGGRMRQAALMVQHISCMRTDRSYGRGSKFKFPQPVIRKGNNKWGVCFQSAGTALFPSPLGRNNKAKRRGPHQSSHRKLQ